MTLANHLEDLDQCGKCDARLSLQDTYIPNGEETQAETVKYPRRRAFACETIDQMAKAYAEDVNLNFQDAKTSVCIPAEEEMPPEPPENFMYPRRRAFVCSTIDEMAKAYAQDATLKTSDANKSGSIAAGKESPSKAEHYNYQRRRAFVCSSTDEMKRAYEEDVAAGDLAERRL